MDDAGNVFRAMKRHNIKHKTDNITKSLNYLNKIDANYEVFNNGYQLNFYRSFGIISFYPSTNKWVYNGKVFYGTAKNLIGWIKNKEKEMKNDG